MVWLKEPTLPPRCIVKITNVENGKRVWCEALQIDDNFLRRYNEPPRLTIDDPISSIVVPQWYRARLGLKTGQEVQLRISSTWLWAKVFACLEHPQVMVRVGTWLGLLSFLLGLLSIGLSLISLLQARSSADIGPTPDHADVESLTLEDVLKWKETYANLIGKPPAAAIERYGPPLEDNLRAIEQWAESPRSGNRAVDVDWDLFDDRGIYAVRVYRRPGEFLPISEIWRRITQFEIKTGTYSGSTTNYLAALDKEQGYIVQFTMTDEGPLFNCIVLVAGNWIQVPMLKFARPLNNPEKPAVNSR